MKNYLKKKNLMKISKFNKIINISKLQNPKEAIIKMMLIYKIF